MDFVSNRGGTLLNYSTHLNILLLFISFNFIDLAFLICQLNVILFFTDLAANDSKSCFCNNKKLLFGNCFRIKLVEFVLRITLRQTDFVFTLKLSFWKKIKLLVNNWLIICLLKSQPSCPTLPSVTRLIN